MNQLQHFKYQYPLIAIAALLLGIGYFSYTHIKTGLFPDITFPKIKIIADAGQQPVDKMMIMVTVPLENSIKRTEGLDFIRSTTSRGSCEIAVFLNWDADIDKAKQQIESFINQVKNDLPQGVAISVEKMNPSILQVMGYSLEGNRSQVELKKIATYQIKPYLAATPGVADVGIIGGKKKEYQIILDQQKLSTLGVSLQQIQNAVIASNILQSNGYINDHNRLYLTLIDNAVDNLAELQNLVLSNTSNRLIRLRDVADVELHEVKEYVKINANGKDVPLIAIMKQPDANLIDVNNGVEKRVEELRDILPKDLKIIPYYKQADFVNDSIKSIRDVLWIGMLLAIFVVILFLRSVSTSIVVLFSIPVTLCLTLFILQAIGYTFNIMTLGAIAAAMGLLIDDAVIVVEQIHRSQEEEPGESLPYIISKAMRYLFPALIASSLCTIVIFTPFSLMSGVAGAYFKVLAYTMVIALSASFFVSWLVLPAIFLVFPEKTKKSTNHIPLNTKWISWIIRRP